MRCDGTAAGKIFRGTIEREKEIAERKKKIDAMRNIMKRSSERRSLIQLRAEIQLRKRREEEEIKQNRERTRLFLLKEAAEGCWVQEKQGKHQSLINELQRLGMWDELK